MTFLKKLNYKYFQGFTFFYSYLKYRVFIMMFFSILIGVLDGLGLSMFLPLLQLVNENSSTDPEGFGKLQFLIIYFRKFNIPFSLSSVFMVMLIFFIAKGLIQYTTGVYKVKVQQWFIGILRNKSLKGLDNINYKYFATTNSGRIQNTLTGEIYRVAASYLNYFDTLQYGILVLVFFGFALILDFSFAILVMIGGLLSNFLFKNIYKNTRRISKNLTSEGHKYQNLIIQKIGNYKYLKSTGLLQLYNKKLEISVKQIENKSVKMGKLDALVTSAREPVLIGVVIVVIYIQITFLNSDLGPILLSLLFFYRALSYVMLMQLRYTKFLSVSGSLENIQVLEKELEENKSVNGSIVINNPIKKLELYKVNFSYDDTLVLKDFSLTIESNETVALVGESGSGKTTLVNIISGLLAVSKGSYEINGIDQKDIDIFQYQKKIGYITQDPVIFNDTLFNNITFWEERSPQNEELFWAVTRQAAIFDFVQSLPDKENTLLGGNGINISGGQRQRISIARELFKNVEILILDEATSSLDSETERIIQLNINKLKGEKILLIIAHRISTVQMADKIVVLKNGEINGIGGYQELLNSNHYFKKLVDLQNLT